MSDSAAAMEMERQDSGQRPPARNSVGRTLQVFPAT
jgi:hypothetical protein